MPSAIPFDTHAFVKMLIAAGVPEPQAEVHAQALSEIVIEHLATKDDLRASEERVMMKLGAMEERFEAKLGGMEERFEARLKDVELRLTPRLGAMLVAAVAISAALKLL